MSKVNRPTRAPQRHARYVGTPVTHEGGPAANISPEDQLRRLTAACLLWEDNFYEGGVEIAGRIKELVPQCRPDFVAACAHEMRTRQNLRHAPLLLVREMARSSTHKHLVGRLLPDVIQRADELSEFMAIYWKEGRIPVSKQVKKGLAAAFPKFNEYQLAKYNRDGAVKLRDVLFQCHAKPKDAEQEALWKRLIDGTLATPDTWEVELSAGKDKKETFERLMAEKKLGALAFLRNLRNMMEAKVDAKLVAEYARNLDISKVLPFRFLAAARAVPGLEPMLEPLMLRACEGREKLAGHTVVLLDVSGSMGAQISQRSDITRLDAAAGVAILLRELCETVTVYSFSSKTVQVPPRRGFALRDAIVNSQPHSSTYMGAAVGLVNAGGFYDRLVCLTDEQTADAVPNPSGKGYVINVASNSNGVGYGAWMHIDGFSEACIDYIIELEKINGK